MWIVVFKLTIDKQKNLLVRILFYTVVLGLAYLALKLLAGPLLPFTLALAVAVSLQGIIRFLCERLHFKRGFAAVSLVITVYTVIGVAVVWLVRALYRQLTELIATLPEYSEDISRAISDILDKINGFFGRMPDIGNGILEDIPTTALSSLAERATEFITQFAADFAQGIPAFLLSLAVMIIATAYFAKDYVRVETFLTDNLPQGLLEKLIGIKEGLLKKLGKLLKGYLLIVGMTFLELLIGLGLLKIKYALIIAAVTALVDILPVLGSGTVLIPWAVFCALAGNVGRAVGLVVLYIIITIIRNVTEPKIIGSKLGVHPVLMLVSVFLGLRLFKGIGVIIAPIAVIVAKSIFEHRTHGTLKNDKAGGQ